MLPTTIKMNGDNGTSVLVFSNPTRDGNRIVYTAPSPQGDFEGRPTLEFSSNVSKGNVVGTLVKVTFPYWDSTAGKYDGFITHSTTIKRLSRHNLVTVRHAVSRLALLDWLDGSDVDITDAVLVALSENNL